MTYRSRCEGRRRVPGHIVEDIRIVWGVTRAVARAIARDLYERPVEVRWTYRAEIVATEPGINLRGRF